MSSRTKYYSLLLFVILFITNLYVWKNILFIHEQKPSVIDAKVLNNNLMGERRFEPIKKPQLTIDYSCEHDKNEFIDYYLRGYLGKAMQIAEETLNLKSNDTEAIVNLGIVHKELMLQDSLEIFFHDIIERNQNSIEVYETIFNILIDNSYIDKAIDLLYKGIDQNSNNTIFYYLLGDKLCDLGRYEEAVDIYNRAIRINPNDHGAYYNLALIFDSMGNQELAAEAYNASQELLQEITNMEE
jgi:tetratricopeptide (TPR) repeat protein